MNHFFLIKMNNKLIKIKIVKNNKIIINSKSIKKTSNIKGKKLERLI
jgi:hypothetical protein